jgi:glycerol-3-phosphate dehydrogenase
VTERIYDLAVIGGGINGSGIARDAAGRGLSVYLCEQADLASGTSSASTKLVHGGLRYLEHREFRLVREALIEREVLLRAAPHIIRPLRFVLPHQEGMRPSWLLRFGLLLYDSIGGRKILPPTQTLHLASSPYGAPLKPGFDRAFEYSDCWVDDARLVVLNAMDAAARGATIETRTCCTRAERDGTVWRLTLERRNGGSPAAPVRARALVNAAGPWVADVLQGTVRSNAPSHVRLVKGSHIVVRKLFEHDRAYIFQSADQRVVFAIPYEHDFTLIGTTDLDYRGDPAAIAIDQSEIDYLCAVATGYFRRPVTPADIAWTYSGVRPLYDDGASKAQEATRDYVLELEAPPASAPLLSVFGGKITTYRKLAEAALEKLASHLTIAAPWTANAALPGGDFSWDGAEALARALRRDFPFLGDTQALRLVRAYGTRARKILGQAKRAEDLGRDFGAGLTEAEILYLQREEWAESAEDVLWRRSKLGLHMSEDERAGVEAFLRGAPAAIPAMSGAAR